MKSIKTAGESFPKATRRACIGLVVIALPLHIGTSMELTVLNLALPYISAALKPGSSQLLWIVDIYGFMVAGFLITMGTLGDRIGCRRLLLTGAAAFGVTSVAAAFSHSAASLIAARAVLGIAGATLAPSTLSLIRNMFHDPQQRTFAIGVWITSYSVGGVVGPLVGGLVLQHYWWGAVFLIAVPVMALLLVLGPLLLPEYKDPAAAPVDILSAVLSMTAVLAVISGLKKMAESGAGLFSLGSIAAGIIVGALFLRRQKHLALPLIDLKLFQVPSFSFSLLTYTLATFATFGMFFFTFQYMELIGRFLPIKAGLYSLPFFAAFIAGSMLAPLLVQRFAPVHVMTSGLFMAAAGFGLLTLTESASGLSLLVTGSTVYCLGLSFIFTLATDIIVGGAPPEKAGAASALSETGSELGGALGIAVLGSIGMLVYRSRLSGNLPAGLSSAAAGAAKETLGGAASQARRLLPGPGKALMAAADDAFIHGMHAAAFVSTAVILALAIFSVAGYSSHAKKTSR